MGSSSPRGYDSSFPAYRRFICYVEKSFIFTFAEKASFKRKDSQELWTKHHIQSCTYGFILMHYTFNVSAAKSWMHAHTLPYLQLLDQGLHQRKVSIHYFYCYQQCSDCFRFIRNCTMFVTKSCPSKSEVHIWKSMCYARAMLSLQLKHYINVGYRGRSRLLEYLTVETAVLLKICRRYSILETPKSRIFREGMPPRHPQKAGNSRGGFHTLQGTHLRLHVHMIDLAILILSKVVLMW